MKRSTSSLLSAALSPRRLSDASHRLHRPSLRSAAHRCVTELLESRALLNGSVLITVAQDSNNNGQFSTTDARLSGWTVYVDF